MYSPFQLAKKYARYYFTASNSKGHGMHSPFVFDFIKNVLNDKRHFYCYGVIEKLREKLLQNNNTIEVQDFGAGSAVMKTNTRPIKKMAQSSLKPKKFAQLLFRIVNYYQPKTLLELGTSFGITTSYLAAGNAYGIVYSCEGAPEVAKVAQHNFDTLQLENIVMTLGDFKQTLPPLLNKIRPVDFAFVDGNHRRQPTIDYFQQLLQVTKPTSILIFDDIHWSREMEAAWEFIKQHPAVTQTIDLFFIGIVLLSPDFKEKQHHRIRF